MEMKPLLTLWLRLSLIPLQLKAVISQNAFKHHRHPGHGCFLQSRFVSSPGAYWLGLPGSKAWKGAFLTSSPGGFYAHSSLKPTGLLRPSQLCHPCQVPYFARKCLRPLNMHPFWVSDYLRTRWVKLSWACGLQRSVCLYFSPVPWLCLKMRLFRLYLYSSKIKICFHNNLLYKQGGSCVLIVKDKRELLTENAGCRAVLIIGIYAKKGRERNTRIHTRTCLYIIKHLRGGTQEADTGNRWMWSEKAFHFVSFCTFWILNSVNAF